MMEGISSTRLLLNVDVTRLEGTMTVNIPPPPSDRLWLVFSAMNNFRVGDYEVLSFRTS